MDWLKIGKEYIKTIYCYPAYLTYMQSQSVQLLSRVQLFVTSWTAACQASLSITNSQSTSFEISGCDYRLESRLLGEISITSDIQVMPL